MPLLYHNSKQNPKTKLSAGNSAGVSIPSELIINISEENLPEGDCDIRLNWSTSEMVFVPRQFQEKSA